MSDVEAERYQGPGISLIAGWVKTKLAQGKSEPISGRNTRKNGGSHAELLEAFVAFFRTLLV
jgi:hypothetical protein